MNGSAGSPFVAMRATIDETNWTGLVPGRRYQGAVRARSTITESEWSDWSSLDIAPKGYCLSAPSAPKGFKRDPNAIRSGQVRLVWNAVTEPSEAGWDNPLEGTVVYDIWGRPGGNLSHGKWRRLSTQPSHTDHDAISSTPMQVAEATLTVDTFPETTIGTFWSFKVRVGNRNGVFGLFSDEIELCSAALPSVPQFMQASFSSKGRAYLYWQAPAYNGDVPVLHYEVRCTDTAPWEMAPNTALSHVLTANLPVGEVPCYVRAVNAVGAGPIASASVRVLQPAVQVS